MSYNIFSYEYETPTGNDDQEDLFKAFNNYQNDLDRATHNSNLEYNFLNCNMEETAIIEEVEPQCRRTASEGITPGAEYIQMKFEDEITPGGMEIETNSDTLNQEIRTILQGDNAKLKQLVEKLMQGVEPNDQELQELHDIERNIFINIKEKKLYTDEERNNKGKRAEEKQKMFFKAVLKNTEKIFFDNLLKSKKKIKRKQLDQLEYYSYYFSEPARKLNIDLSNFYHPNKKLKSKDKQLIKEKPKNKDNAGLKSLNSTYIDLILSSELFRQDALYFLDEIFVQDYIKTRYKKIDKLLKQIKKIVAVSYENITKTATTDAVFGSASSSAHEVKYLINKEVKQLLLFNSKSKLPWTNAELEEAREFARLAFRKFPQQN